MYLQGMHVTFPSTYKLIFSFDEFIFGIGTLQIGIIVIENFCHRIFGSIRASTRFESAIIGGVDYRYFLTLRLIFILKARFIVFL
jgi:uncharacterized membrane protein